MPDESFDITIRTTAETGGAEQTSQALGEITAKTEAATAATAEYVDVQKIAEEASAAAAAAKARENSIFGQQIVLLATQQRAIDAKAAGRMEEAAAAEAEAAEMKLALDIQSQSAATEAEALVIAKERIAVRAKEAEELEAQVLLTKKLKADEIERVAVAREQAAATAESAATGNQVLRGAARASGLGRNTGLAALAGPEVLGAVIALQVAWDVLKHNIHSAREEAEAFKKASKEAAEESAKHLREMAESAKKGMQEAKDEAQAYITALKEMMAVTTASKDKLDDSKLKKALSDIDQQEAKDIRQAIVDEGDNSHQTRAQIAADANKAREEAKVYATVDRAGRDEKKANADLQGGQSTETLLKPQATSAKEDAEVKAMQAKVAQEMADNATKARQHAQQEAGKAANALFEAMLNPGDSSGIAAAVAADHIAKGKLANAKSNEDFAKGDATEAQKKSSDASNRAAALAQALETVTKQVKEFGDAAATAKNAGVTAAMEGAKEISKVEKQGAETVQAAIKQDLEEKLKPEAERKATNEAVRKQDAKQDAKPGAKKGETDFNAFFHDNQKNGPSGAFSDAFGSTANQHQIDTRPKAQQAKEHQDMEIIAGAVMADAGAAMQDSNHGKSPPWVMEMINLMKAQTAHMKSLASPDSHMSLEAERELAKLREEITTITSELERTQSQFKHSRGG